MSTAVMTNRLELSSIADSTLKAAARIGAQEIRI
jgi:hypothetical protein